MKTILTLFMIVLTLFINTKIMIGQDEKEEFIPSGSPYAKIYSNFHVDLTEGNQGSAFEIKRAYLGYKYKMSKHYSAKAYIDISNPKNGSALEHTAFIKIAALTYKSEKIVIDFGLIDLKQFYLQEKYWGHRYIYKSFQDEHKFGSRADLGSSISYKINKIVSIDATIMNGEGYKKIQYDNTLKGGLGLTLIAVKDLNIRTYFDISQKSETQFTLAFFLGYKIKDKLKIGVEYNMQNNHGFNTDNNLTGISAYASYNINEKFEIFGRFDQLSSNTLLGSDDLWNQRDDGSAIISGLQFAPVKGVKIALNYQGWIPDAPNTVMQSKTYLNFEYTF